MENCFWHATVSSLRFPLAKMKPGQSCEICDKLWDFKSYNAQKPIWDVHILSRWMPGCLQTKRIILPNRKVQARCEPLAGEGTLGRTQEGLLGEDPPPRVILVT